MLTRRWFLCREDYRRPDDQAIRWNEFEQIGLEGAHSQPKAQANIRRFWDQHFPFMLAVRSDYDYLAIDLNERSYGRVVHGCGDDFEAPSPLAASFEEFVTVFKEAADNRRDEYPLGYFL